MADFLKMIGTIIFIAGIIAGIILLTKATENIDYVIGISCLIQGVVLGSIFHFFSNMLLNSESQTALLEDIRDHFYPEEETNEGKIICKECETVNNSNYKYCTMCGTNLKDDNPDD